MKHRPTMCVIKQVTTKSGRFFFFTSGYYSYDNLCGVCHVWITDESVIQ